LESAFRIFGDIVGDHEIAGGNGKALSACIRGDQLLLDVDLFLEAFDFVAFRICRCFGGIEAGFFFGGQFTIFC